MIFPVEKKIGVRGGGTDLITKNCSKEFTASTMPCILGCAVL